MKGNYYHIYNRGVDKRIVFENHPDYVHFLELISSVNQLEAIGSLYHYNQNKNEEIKEDSKKLVEIIAYSLLPNHFHLLVRESIDGGISKFMQKVSIGYTNRFNIKNKRSGSLFQGKYKSVTVDNEDYLLYLSAYILGNSEIHRICKAGEYNYSNYNIALAGKARMFNKYILKNFSSIEVYCSYLNDVVKNSKTIKQDKKMYTLE